MDQPGCEVYPRQPGSDEVETGTAAAASKLALSETGQEYAQGRRVDQPCGEVHPKQMSSSGDAARAASAAPALPPPVSGQDRTLSEVSTSIVEEALLRAKT